MQKNQIRCKCNNIGVIVTFQYIEKLFFKNKKASSFRMQALKEAFI